MSGRFIADRQPVAHNRNRAAVAIPRRRLNLPLPSPSNRAPTTVGGERVVPRQIEAVRDVLQIGQDLGLRREALRPRPAALQVVVERVGIVDTFDIAARARIAIPVPRASDAGAASMPSTVRPSDDTTVYGVQPGEARADHDRIDSSRAPRRQQLRMSAHSSSRAEAPAANGMMVTKPWNSTGKSRCTTGTFAARSRCA